MAGWQKRLTKEDVAALAEEITACTKAQGRGSLRGLAKMAGLNDSMLHHIRSGASGTTVPTALRIRNAIRTMLEAPPGQPAQPQPVQRRVHGQTIRFEKLAADQEPLRERVRAIMAADRLSQSEVARRAGLHSSTVSSFVAGKNLQTKNRAKLERMLDGVNGKAKPARAAMVQHRLPLAGLNGHTNGAGMRRIDVVAARFQTLHEPAQPSDAVALAHAFIQRTGLEAIETLLQIAKSNPNGDEPQ